MKKRIAVNLWLLRNKNYDGIGYYSINTISLLVKNHPEYHFDLLMPSNYHEDFFDFPNAQIHKIFPPLRHPLLYVFFIEIVVPIYALIIRPDVILSMDGMVSLFLPKKQIATIYDLNFHHFPEVINFRNRFYYNFFYPKYAKKAQRIQTISEFSLKDIAETYHIPLERIDNVSCAANIGVSVPDENQNRQVKEAYADGKEYFFFIGSQMPRKNLTRMILGFDAFKKETHSDMKLIIAGRMSWDSEVLKDLLPKISSKEDIVFAGRVTDEELLKLLSASYSLCYVSLFEGFGIPILEAMNSNVPIICSNTSSMPEVGGDAAIYVDPFSVEDIAQGMKIMYKNENQLREQLIRNGQVQRNKFSWEKSSEWIMQSIEKVL